MNTELAAAALSARNRRLVVPGNPGVTGDLVGDMVRLQVSGGGV